MEEKIDKDLQIELRGTKGPYRVSIRGVSKKLDELVYVNRYEGMNSERLFVIGEETKRILAPICACLESYGLINGRNYISDELLRNVSALLTKSQIENLALQDYVGSIGRNFQKGLPF